MRKRLQISSYLFVTWLRDSSGCFWQSWVYSSSHSWMRKGFCCGKKLCSWSCISQPQLTRDCLRCHRSSHYWSRESCCSCDCQGHVRVIMNTGVLGNLDQDLSTATSKNFTQCSIGMSLWHIEGKFLGELQLFLVFLFISPLHLWLWLEVMLGLRLGALITVVVRKEPVRAPIGDCSYLSLGCFNVWCQLDLWREITVASEY